jgi:transcriptional regulator with XRE-family HTH domain
MELHMPFLTMAAMNNPELPESRRYLERVMRETGLDLTSVARKASVHPSTITRPFNDLTYKRKISLAVLRKIAKATKVAMPEGMDPLGIEPSPDEADLAVSVYELMPEGRALTKDEKRRITKDILQIVRRHFGR